MKIRSRNCAAIVAGQSVCAFLVKAASAGAVLREYSAFLKASGVPVKNPGGLAVTLGRTGEADFEVDKWLAERENTDELGASEGSSPELLKAILSAISTRVNREAFDQYFGVRWVKLEGDALHRALHVALQGPLQAAYIKANYADVMEEVLAEVGLEGCELVFLTGRAN